MSSDEEEISEEQQFYLTAQKNVRPEVVAALVAINIDTMGKLLVPTWDGSYCAMDAAIGDIHRKLNALDASTAPGMMQPGEGRGGV